MYNNLAKGKEKVKANAPSSVRKSVNALNEKELVDTKWWS